MTNADSFLRAFSAIEKWLRSTTGLDRSVGFYVLVDRAADRHAAVRRFRDDLKEFADLRNAIVHERGGGYVIAEPNTRAVRDLEDLETILLSPPKVIPTFQHKVDVADHASPLAGVVSRMSTRKFSQLPVTKDGRFVGVLTTNTIARWLGAHAADGMALLDDTPVGKVLDHAESAENYVFVSRSTTLFQILDHFDRFESQGRALDAILITEQGKSTTAFLGIITFYDIAKIHKLLGVRRAAHTRSDA